MSGATTTSISTANGPATTGKPASIGPAAVAARVRRVGKVTVSGHIAKVKLSCTAATGASCGVKASLSIVETFKGKRLIAVTAEAGEKHKANRRTVVLARNSAKVEAGRKFTLRLTLNKAGTKLLARRSFQAKLSVMFASKMAATALVTFKHT